MTVPLDLIFLQSLYIALFWGKKKAKLLCIETETVKNKISKYQASEVFAFMS